MFANRSLTKYVRCWETIFGVHFLEENISMLILFSFKVIRMDSVHVWYVSINARMGQNLVGYKTLPKFETSNDKNNWCIKAFGRT